jgi:ribose 5-phosphate isomerase B
MKISLGADHAGYEQKETIKEFLPQQGIHVDDKGTYSTDPVDYPDYARAVGEEVANRGADLGILVCGTGIGMSISANKVPGIRAAHATSEFEAEMSRAHNDANILCLGARILDEATTKKMVEKFLSTPFAAGRHQRRVAKIEEIEGQEFQERKLAMRSGG